MLIHYSDGIEKDIRDEIRMEFPDGRGGIRHGAISIWHEREMKKVVAIIRHEREVNR